MLSTSASVIASRISVHDRAARAIEDRAQVIGRAAEVQVGDVDEPSLFFEGLITHHGDTGCNSVVATVSRSRPEGRAATRVAQIA
jgi:hypothetical protein